MEHIYIKYLDTNKIGILEGIDKPPPTNTYVVISKDDYVDIAKVIGVSSKLYDVKSAFFIRKAAKSDISKMEHLEKLSKDYIKIAKEMAISHNISLKFAKSYIPLDNTKSFFYYTAESRVDFRQFVKDLAKAIKKRIEMRQVGVKDAVQMIGAVGICGRKTCCSNFMDNFETTSLKDLEFQNLPMSPSKFTGPCGKLVCCMSFEKVNYAVKYILPSNGTNICINQKEYTIDHVDPITNTVNIKNEEEKLTLNLSEILPEGYDIAMKKCASCGGCCARSEESHIHLEEVMV